MEQHPRLVVTGGGGQLGRALASLPGADQATFLDLPSFDLTDGDGVRATLLDAAPELIIHAGAYTAVDGAEGDEAGARAVNAAGSEAVAGAAEELGALVVYVSTDYVFPGDAREPYREDAPTRPLSVYGATKLAGEEAVKQAPQHLIVRTSWVFGEGKNFVRAILGAARSGKVPELAVVDDQIGRPTYAPDLAQGLLDLVAAGATGTYHLQGGGEPGSWADVAEVALEAAGVAVPVRRVATADYNAGRPGPIARRPSYSVLDCSRAEALGAGLRDWRDAVAAYVKVCP